MGKHFLLNLYGCSFELLNDPDYLIELIESAATSSRATVVQTIFKKFEPQGCTVLTLLSESHFTIHTWPEEGKAAADCFTCGDCDPKIGCDLIIEKLQPTEYKLTYIQR